MADGDHNGIMQVVSHGLDTGGDTVTVVTGNIGEQPEDEVCEEDILQQALDEASESYQEGSVQYMMDSQIVNSVGEGVTFITENGEVTVPDEELDGTYETATYQVIGSVANGDAISFPVNSSSIVPETSGQLQLQQAVLNEIIQDHSNSQQQTAGQTQVGQSSNEGTENVAEPSTDAAGTSGTSNFTVIAPTSSNVRSAAAPLGSSQNPIRIIQQGNQYTPVQQLTTEQLQQIMQVVQQQQVTKSESESGSCVLYNPQTNTKIVYRVIYPTELHKGPDGEGAKVEGQHTVYLQSTPKRTYKKRSKEDDERIEGPELSKEEKDQRKKARQKTRSGRVSKPPKHMVQDYKHIHVLDFDEDLDDSDGGYSDFKVSDDEGEGLKGRTEDQDKYISPGILSGKPKNWKCETCAKAYIGKAGLARHFKLYPSHGKLEEDVEGGIDNDGNSNPVTETPNGINSTASFSEDSRDSTSSLSYTPTPVLPRPRGRGGFRGRRSWRGRGAAYRLDSEARRKLSLKEIVKECADEELMEIVLPRLAKVISLWEFLLMKVEKGSPPKPSVVDVYNEYGNLHQDVRKMCQDCLQLQPEEEDKKPESQYLQFENNVLAESLGLKTGLHIVKEIPPEDDRYVQSFKHLINKAETCESAVTQPFLKRSSDFVTSTEDLAVPVKKLKQDGADGKAKATTTYVLSNVNRSPAPVVKTLGPSSSPLKFSNSGTGSFKVMPSAVKSLLPSSLGKAMTVSLAANKPATSVSTGNALSSASKGIVQIVGGGLVSAKSSQPNVKTNSPKTVSLLASSSQLKQTVPTSAMSTKQVQPQQYYIVPRRPSSASTHANVVALTNSTPQVSGPRNDSHVLVVGPPPRNNLSTTATPSNTSSLISFSNSNLNNISYSNSTSLLTNLNATSLLTGQLGSSTTDADSNMLNSKADFTKPSTDSAVSSIISTSLTSSSKSGAQRTVTSASHDLANQSYIDQTDSSVPPVDIRYSDQSSIVVLNDTSKSDVKNDVNPNHMNMDVNSEAAMTSTDIPITVLSSGDSFINSIENAVYTISSSLNSGLSSSDPDSFVVQAESGMPVMVVEENMATEGDSSMLNSGDVLTRDYHHDQELEGVVNGNGEADQHPQTSSDTDMVSIIDSQMGGEDGQLVQYQTGSVEGDMGGGEVEAVQISSTNIFQTADGIIIIQNPDGTTVQLQGSDGQNIPMETVQALLAMEGETQFITEQSAEHG